METFNDFNAHNIDNSVLILGFFDGFHLGHKVVIRTAIEYAKKNNCKTALITFKDAPAILLKNKNPQYILTYEDKIKILEEMDIDYLYQLNFDEKLSKMPAADYLKILVDNLFVACIFTS